eukprot:493240_1
MASLKLLLSAYIILAGNALDLNLLSVPAGFTVTRYIDEDSIYKPRSLALGYYNNATIVYVGTGSEKIYALIDYESDSINDKIYLIWSAASGEARNLALDNNNNVLYIAAYENTYQCKNIHSKILSFTDINHTLTDSDCTLWFQGPSYKGHGDHYMAYDHLHDQLCMEFGANGNIVARNYPETYILCFNNMEYPDIENVKIQAKGVRHSVGMEFHPTTNDLWFTDNNADRMGDNIPDGKLNRVTDIGEDFGYPYCHSGGFGDPYLRDVGVACHIVDDVFGDEVNGNCSNFSLSVQCLGPHVAPLGMKFYYNKWNDNGYMYENKYYQSVFVAQHGSWNRVTKIGARVMVVYLGCDKYNHDYSKVIGYESFLDGMIKGDSYIGRPVDVEMLYDGSLLISDDTSMNIYRIIYDVTFVDNTLRNEELCLGNDESLQNMYGEYCNVTITDSPSSAPSKFPSSDPSSAHGILINRCYWFIWRVIPLLFVVFFSHSY